MDLTLDLDLDLDLNLVVNFMVFNLKVTTPNKKAQNGVDTVIYLI